MITALQLDLGVRYNPDRINDPDFSNSRDLFIHGMIEGSGGTCASMPVLYVAIGRRLGYPLKLAEAKAHLFCRWDDPEGKFWLTPERFNIEGASRGLTCYPDDAPGSLDPCKFYTRLYNIEIRTPTGTTVHNYCKKHACDCWLVQQCVSKLVSSVRSASDRQIRCGTARRRRRPRFLLDRLALIRQGASAGLSSSALAD